MAGKDSDKSKVGDTKSPPLKTDGIALRHAVEQAQQIPGNKPGVATPINPASSLGASLESKPKQPPGDCVQTIWFSFFFDGTGNNMDADSGMSKHSNVVRLYRAHRGIDPGRPAGSPDPADDGIFRLYIPGCGTYFKEKGDDGDDPHAIVATGLGFAAGGSERLDWALEQFDAAMKKPIARTSNFQNRIVEINISAYGFSRGAALARAFIQKFVNKRVSKEKSGQSWLLDKKYPIRIRFMGIFDTVASVGVAMSANDMKPTTNVDTLMNLRGVSIFSTTHTSGTLPWDLAFSEKSLFFRNERDGAPGADPAPGSASGHDGWGDSMVIPDMVEDVRHFIAGHEMRQSFPVDSVTVLNKDGSYYTGPTFKEAIYPGVHSDIGGSYRPGEQGKGNDSNQKLGLIPLADMYNFAMKAGVPFLPRTAWKQINKDDFNVSLDVIKSYNYYQSKISAPGTVGDQMNAHMGLYYAWRFRHIRIKASDHTEATNINNNEKTFQHEQDGLETDIQKLQNQDNAAQANTDQLTGKLNTEAQNNFAKPNYNQNIQNINQQITSAKAAQVQTHDNLLRAKAKLSALPKDQDLVKTLAIYDQHLMNEAEKIYLRYAADPSLRNSLRPHYKAMMTAYENEYINKKGLDDQQIISFFDNYVHDSLAGFAKDATCPSDPRVIFMGGDEKYKYAQLDKTTNGDGSETMVA